MVASSRKISYFHIILWLCFSNPVNSHTAPFVDGDCAEYKDLLVKPVSLSKDLNWYTYEDHGYVWFCFEYPPGGFGAMDLQIETPKLQTILNLHASAQLGEWPINQPGLKPKKASSELWWNNKGWHASHPTFNGFNDSTDPESIRFRKPKASEVQFSKKRFGSGVWKIHVIAISHIKREVFPKENEPLYIIEIK